MNAETAVNNHYQSEEIDDEADDIQRKALYEFDSFTTMLNSHKIETFIYNDTLLPSTPDSIFPNNWLSFHLEKIVLYPMFAANRRLERTEQLIDAAFKFYTHQPALLDLTSFESGGKFLEGTGSLVLDRINKIAYMGISARSNIELANEWALTMGYQLITFEATQVSAAGRVPIYHTNVMLSIGTKFAAICPASITDVKQREFTVNALKNSQREILELSEKQLENFAGNMLEVKNVADETFIVMSSAAYYSLNKFQINQLESCGSILHQPLKTIEKYGGGSARCMMAEIFV